MEEAQIRVCFETHWQGFACNPADSLQPAIAHLRDVLGDQTYESLARQGERMSTTAIVTYAYDQIDQARAELKAVSK
jgi:hypothetical protein